MDSADIREQVDLIREVFSYAERFRGSTFVMKIDDRIVDHPDFSQHARDIALLHKSGIRVLIVPGARGRIDEVLDRYGVERRFADGIRVSDPESMDLVKMAAFDVAHRVMTALSGHRITAVIGNWVRARSRGVLDGVDFGRTGLVDRIHVPAVVRSLEQGHIPILPCIGHNDSGDPFNLSSNELAGSAATALNARKLFLLTPSDVMRRPEWTVPDGIDVLEDGRIFRMTPARVAEFLDCNPDKPDREVLQTAAEVCRGGVERAHILDGRQNGALLKEIFSNLGVGTMVFADAYERLRPMESSDVPGILEIMQPLIAEGVLVERSREELERHRGDYWVYAMDGVVHGCAALHRRDAETAEIAGLAVDPRYAQLGIGAKLVDRLSEKAGTDGFRRIIVLTTRTADWFLARGFQDGTVSDLPESRRRDYDASRNSRVLVKDLSPAPPVAG